MIARRLLRHSVRAMGRYKLRSAFMMAGTLVGVAGLTLTVSVGAGAHRKVLATTRQLFGASSLIVVAGGAHLLSGPRPDAARLTLDDIDAVATAVPEIVIWDPQQIMNSVSIRRADATRTARILGASERFARVWERGVSRGRGLDAADVASSARVALIGETVAHALFPQEDPIGAEILVGQVRLEIIGILERFGTDLHGMDRDNEVVVPISTAMRRLMNVDTIAAAKLLVHDPERGEEVAGEVRRLLRERHALGAEQPDDFSMITAVEVQRMVAGIERILFLYLPLAAGVALLVGAIVAATVMLSSVDARRGEIGLRRAVGARVEDIRLQFLLETAATTLAGGLAGLAIGYAGAQAASNLLQLDGLFSWTPVILGFLASVITGLVAGLLPARRAARVNPVDALR